MRAAFAARMAVCLASVLAAVVGIRSAGAQTCTEPPRVPFAGHTFPLDTPPAQQPMSSVDAFPNLPSFSIPVFITYAPDGTNRLFVVEKTGAIKVFDNDPNASSTQTFIDLTTSIDSSDNELGLLGLAFDPNFPTNHYFYVDFTSSGTRCAAGSGYCTKVMRYTVPPATPNAADPNSAYELLEFVQPFTNHNGGMLAFGPDHLLWIGTGDGGSGGDPMGNGQNPNVLLAKLLRIDPSSDDFPSDPRRNYHIPPGNPHANGVGGAPEWWALGLRNPWRYSFDRLTGDLIIGDVGQDLYEEVDYVSAAARATPPAGGYNFGWNICEGFHDYAGNCAASGTTPPVIEYAHSDSQNGGSSVTGGYVYRGNQLPGLYGAYVYGDFISGNLFVWDLTLPAHPTTVAILPNGPTSFGEDRDGELYYTTYPGRVMKLQFNSTPPAPFPANLSQTGLFANTATLTPAPGLVEYDVNAPLWSDGAAKRRWVALPAGQTAHFEADGSFDFPIGTALVKHFEIATSPTTTRRLETRVFLHQVDRWTGFTYRWNSAQTDATLLSDAASDTITFQGGSQQTWNYPSPAQCLVCHSAPEKRVLGPRVLQLNKTFNYPSGADNELHAWECMGMFDKNPPSTFNASFGKYASLGDTTSSVQQRARSYLASNCSICHQPGGPAPSNMDFRWSRLLGELNAIGVAPSEGDLGIGAGAQRIHVGVPAQSIVYVRQQSTNTAIRMPANSQVPDPNAVPVFGTWITSGLATLDSDGDGVPDATDNCPRTSNASQADGGGFGTSAADGVGNACQCGDVSGDGKVDSSDLSTVRKILAHTLATSYLQARRCESPSDTGECTVVSWARIAKGLSGASAAHGQTCPAASSLGP